VKRWVFNPALNCPRLMDDERSCGGNTFQTAGAATWKLCRPSCVLVEGTSMSWRSAELRFARPEMPATGTLLKYRQDGAHAQSTSIVYLVCLSDCAIRKDLFLTPDINHFDSHVGGIVTIHIRKRCLVAEMVAINLN